MRDRLFYLLQRLDTSIWLIPIGLCLIAALLAIVMLWFDRLLINYLPSFSAVLVSDLSFARQVLSVIAGSIISVGGVAFSVTIVALTLTSGQYGPKMLRTFLEDNNSKVSLGLFLATYIYTLIALTGIQTDDHPQLTVVVALILAFLTLLGFIRFIHHTATDLQADEIIHRIGGRLEEALQHMVDEKTRKARDASTIGWRRLARTHQPFDIASVKQGYVQSIDYPGLVNWCRENDALLEVRVRAGDFILEGIALYRAFSCRDAELPETTVHDLNDFALTGPIRTPLQDPEYPITQINQLAARALSPGINDPGTAITCIDWFALALGRIVDHEFPGCIFLDRDDTPRLIARTTHFEGLMRAVYAPLRKLASRDTTVLATLMKSLCHLAQLTQRPDRLAIIAFHGRLIWEMIDRQALMDEDTRELKQRYIRLQHATRPPDAAR